MTREKKFFEIEFSLKLLNKNYCGIILNINYNS